MQWSPVADPLILTEILARQHAQREESNINFSLVSVKDVHGLLSWTPC